MLREQLKPNVVLRGPIFPEPVQVIVAVPLGASVKVVAKGLRTGQVHEPILDDAQLARLEASPRTEPFDGDPSRFRLGVEALRLGLAYEHDPYFSLSTARVDPLPHQLEAVYDHFLKLPRIRFLLADDPGAGKTVMAGLLLKELKIRGLVKRTLIVTPANLSFQWQREMKDKFREHFEVVRSDVLRANYGTTPGRTRTRSSPPSPGSRAPSRATWRQPPAGGECDPGQLRQRFREQPGRGQATNPGGLPVSGVMSENSLRLGG